jgi:hypothetical protein
MGDIVDSALVASESKTVREVAAEADFRNKPSDGDAGGLELFERRLLASYRDRRQASAALQVQLPAAIRRGSAANAAPPSERRSDSSIESLACAREANNRRVRLRELSERLDLHALRQAP